VAGYFPTWVEVSITLAAPAAFALLYLIFSKLFPVVVVWEHAAGHKAARQPVADEPVYASTSTLLG
jgi:hypothetical protein